MGAEEGMEGGPRRVPSEQGRTPRVLPGDPPQPAPAPAGSFGEVRRGRLQPRGRREQAVAIQALWTGGAESLQMAFLGQAAMLGQFQHPNILRLEGVVTRSRPFMVLTELMELGPLDSFLRVSQAGGEAVLERGGLGRESGQFLAVRDPQPHPSAPSCPCLWGLQPSFSGHSDSKWPLPLGASVSV